MNKKVIIGTAIAASLIFVLLFVGLLGMGMMFKFSKRGSGTMMEQLSDYSGSIGSASKSRNDANYPQGPIGTAESGSGIAESAEADSGFNTMYFEDYGTNVFIETSKDRLSTFGLDVDTASYTICKNYIMRGELPPTDAVRMEEFVNYFDYQYPNPKSAFGIYTEVAQSPFEDNLHLLKIGIKSHEVEERDDAILTFVVDVSGSMDKENRMGLAKKSLRFLVDQLREGDEVAIIKYHTKASVVLEHTSIQDKQRIIDAIEGLEAGGSTNAEAGLKLGYEEAEKALKKGANNRVILISDGVANVGNTGSDSILDQLKEYKEQGISITAVGVGMGNYNDVLLEQIADKGDGNYAYVNDFNEAKRIFSQSLSGTLQTVAKDAKIQVDFNPDKVVKYRLIGYENREVSDKDFRNDEKDAGEIGAGHEITAIYELELKSNSFDLGKIYLRYTDPDNDLPVETSKDIKSQIRTFESSSDRFKLAVSVARFAQVLKLVAPPPSIDKVEEIVLSIEPKDDTEEDFRIVLANAKRMLEIKRGE